MAIKHFFFDMDGTICESRKPISKDIKEVLNKLPNVYVISGASRKLMAKQLKGVKCKILAQNGNDTDKWVHYLSPAQKRRIKRHIQSYAKNWKPRSQVDDRGCQISYSFTGHKADLELKKKYDPNKIKRNKILKKYPFNDAELTVKVAGTTCFDYFPKNGTKGENLKHYMKITDACVYFGDNLQEGGNDHSVVEVMKTIPADLTNIKEKINLCLK